MLGLYIHYPKVKTTTR